MSEEKTQCLDCSGKAETLHDLKEDYYPFKESITAKCNRVIGIVSVVGLIFSALIFFVRDLNAKVYSMSQGSNTVITDVAVIKEQIKSLNTRQVIVEKNQRDSLILQRKILDAVR